MANGKKKSNTDYENLLWGTPKTDNILPGLPVIIDGMVGTSTVDQARVDFMNMFIANPAQYKYYVGILQNKGYEGTPDQVWNIASAAIDYASGAGMYEQGVSVEDYFLAYPSADGSGIGGGPKTTSVYQKQVVLTNRGEAETYLNNSFERNLGRRASNKEIKAFYDALNDLEKANPSIYSGTSTSGAGVSSQSGTSKGGFNAQQFAEEFALSRPEYAENFAATNFMSVLESMIKGGPSLGGNA